VKKHGIVLEAARGPVPSLAEAIAGGPIRGSWWAHEKAHDIYDILNAVDDTGDVLVCKLVNGKVTYVHRRLWPALVKLAARFPKAGLAKAWNEHTKTGAHRARTMPFPKWVPPEVMVEAGKLTTEEAERILEPWVGHGRAQGHGHGHGKKKERQRA
jgi:hypothetical protein